MAKKQIKDEIENVSNTNNNVEIKEVKNKESSNSKIKKEFEAYNIVVKSTALNIRKGPGLEFPVTGIIMPDNSSKKIKIVEEKDGWGKIENSNEWINLNYCEKV